MNPPTVCGAVKFAGSSAQYPPAWRARRKIPVTRTVTVFPVVATRRPNSSPGRSRSRTAVAAGTTAGTAAVPPAAVAGGQVPAVSTAWCVRSGSEIRWICAFLPASWAGMSRKSVLSELVTVSGPLGSARCSARRTDPRSWAAAAAEDAGALIRMPVAGLDRSVARTAYPVTVVANETSAASSVADSVAVTTTAISASRCGTRLRTAAGARGTPGSPPSHGARAAPGAAQQRRGLSRLT